MGQAAEPGGMQLFVVSLKEPPTLLHRSRSVASYLHRLLLLGHLMARGREGEGREREGGLR